jgi:GTPase SAR1 family protein
MPGPLLRSSSLRKKLSTANPITRLKNTTKVFITPWISVMVTMSPLAMCATSWPMTASTSSREAGLVGLPNVGKSTLFNAFVRSSLAAASNYPFTTIASQAASVPVPDARLARLAALTGSARAVPCGDVLCAGRSCGANNSCLAYQGYPDGSFISGVLFTDAFFDAQPPAPRLPPAAANPSPATRSTTWARTLRRWSRS